MADWITKKLSEGTDDETEVHQLRLKLIIVDISREVGHKLWDIQILDAVDEGAVSRIHHEDDLLKSKLIGMTMGMKVLEEEGKELAAAMTVFNKELDEVMKKNKKQ